MWESFGGVELSLRLPEAFERAVCCDGSGGPPAGWGRYLAFWWEPVGDELCWADGVRVVCGANFGAWAMVLSDPVYGKLLSRFALGSSDEAALEALVVDRHRRRLRVAPLGRVLRVLEEGARSEGQAGGGETEAGWDERDDLGDWACASLERAIERCERAMREEALWLEELEAFLADRSRWATGR